MLDEETKQIERHFLHDEVQKTGNYQDQIRTDGSRKNSILSHVPSWNETARKKLKWTSYQTVFGAASQMSTYKAAILPTAQSRSVLVTTLQGRAKNWSPGLENLGPAVAYRFCLNLPENILAT